MAAVEPVPEEGVIQAPTCLMILTNALVDAGVVGVDEDIEQSYIIRAMTQANWLLAQWARKRWLVYRIQDYSVVSTGAQYYTVGSKQSIEINPRPDRLEYAFLRFLNTPNGGATIAVNVADFNADFNADFGPPPIVLPNPSQVYVDVPLDIIQSHEDYARISVKQIGTLSWRIFYDPAWPVGILRPWPIPQASLYELHVGFKVVLPRFASLQQRLNFPPEYEAALNWCLARRLRISYQMPMDPEVNALARDGLNTIRLANQAVPTLQMPSPLRRRHRAYSYQSDGL